MFATRRLLAHMPAKPRPKPSVYPGTTPAKELPAEGHRLRAEDFVNRDYLKTAFPDVSAVTAEQLLDPTSSSWYALSKSRAGELPIYLKKRFDGGEYTVVRKVSGNVSQLKQDLASVLQLPKDKVKIKDVSKKIVISGNHVKPLKQHFAANPEAVL